VLEGFLAAYPGCPVFQALAQGRMLTAKQSTVSNSSKEAAAVSQQPQETESEQRTDTMLVAELQVALIEKGCLGGTPDGIVGIKTLDAIRRYNEQNRAAINAFRLKATDPGIVLSAISQSCDSTIGAANSLCFKFNGETVCE
jgi:peptidoglycan hydrolase-like protein with peptidoglycan-binding domain